MAVRDLTVGLLIKAKDRASKVLGGVTAKATALFSALSAYVGFQAFTDAIKGAGDFEAQLNAVQAKGEFTREEMAMLRDEAKRIGPDFKLTGTQAAEGMEALAAAGLKAEDVVQALPSVLALAKAEKIKTSEAAERLSDSLATVRLGFEQSGRMANVLAKGANISTTSAIQLAESLAEAGGTATDSNMSLEQTVAILAALGNAGIKGSKAGTSLNAMLIQLQNPSSNARKELAALGITSNDLGTVIGELAKRGSAGNRAILAFGETAGPGLRALIAQGQGQLNAFTEQLQNSEGAAKAAADKIDEGLNGALEGLGAAWKSLKTFLVEPIIEPLTRQLENLTQKLRDAVADGSLTAFRESLLTTFNKGIEAVKQFVTEFDFQATLEKLSEFLDRAVTAFSKVDKIGTGAANAVSAAWNGVGAVLNAVNAGISKLVAVWLDALALLAKGGAYLGLIPDDWAKSVEAAADRMNTAAVDFAENSVKAYDRTKNAVQRLRGETERLGNTAQDSGRKAKEAAEEAAQAQEAAAEVARLTERIRLENAAALEQAEREKQQAIEDSTKAQIQSVEDARRSYERLRDSGTASAQDLAEAWLDYQDLLRGVGDRSEGVAGDVSEAFQGLGIQSQAALNNLATQAQANFEEIRADGASAAEDVKRAFLAYADASIKAAEDSSEADRKAVQQKLQLEAAALGLRDALAELSGANTGAATGNDKAADSQRRHAAAARDNADAQEEATEAISEGGSVAQVVADAYNAAMRETEALSTATRELFQSILANAYGVRQYRDTANDAAGAVGEFANKVDDLIDRVRFLEEKKVFLSGVSRLMVEIASASAQAQLAYSEQRLQAEQYIQTLQKLEDGSFRAAAGTENLVKYINRAKGAMTLLNEADLGSLQQAIDAATNKLLALRDAAESARDAAERALLQEQGNKAALLELDYKQKSLELQQLLNDAKATGDRAAIQAINEAIRKEAELLKLRRDNLKQEQSTSAETPSRGSRSSSSAPGRNAGGIGSIAGGELTLRFQGPNGRTVQGRFSEADVEPLLDIFEQSGAVTLN